MPKMLDDEPVPTPTDRSIVRYGYILLTVIVFIILGVPFLRKHDGDWDVTYLLSARHLWRGQSIYHNGDGYIYPPFPAMFALLFTYMPGILPKLTWYAVTVMCFVMLCRWAWKSANGPALSGAPGREHLAFWLGLIPGATYAFNCISHAQTDVLIGFAIIAGCVALTRGRSMVAATCWGFAAAMKGPALIFLPYLIWRRRPLAAGWMIAFFILVNLAPNLVSPTILHRVLLVEWYHDYLAPQSKENVYPDVWFSESNQSWLGSITRWTTTRWEWRGKTYEQRIPLDHPLSPRVRKVLVAGGCAVLLAALGTALGWKPRRLDIASNLLLPAAKNGGAAGFNAYAAPEMKTGGVPVCKAALEFSMVAMLMLICSPMAAKAQWGVLMLPGFCLARICLSRRNPVITICFAAGWVAWVASQNFLSKNAVFVGLWYGAVLWNALFWVAGCYAARISRR